MEISSLSSAVPVKIRVIETPSDASLDYALYQIVLSFNVGAARGPGEGGAATSSTPLTWSVVHRYSDFAALHSSLVEAFEESVQHIPFPPRHPLRSSKDPAVVAERLELLPKWLVAISRIPEVSTSPLFRAFLSLERFERELQEASTSLPPSSTSGLALEASSEQGSPAPSSTRPSSPAVRLEAGHGQAGEREEMETATSTLLPTPDLIATTSRLGPGPPLPTSTTTTTSSRLLHAQQLAEGGPMTATASIPAPAHAGDEYSSATSHIDVRIPSLSVPVDRLVGPVKTEIAEAMRASEEATRLKREAEQAALLARERLEATRIASSTTEATRVDVEELHRMVHEAEERAKLLKREAEQKQHAFDAAKAEQAKRMKEYEAAVAQSTTLAHRAKVLEQEAAAKAAAAKMDHDAAAKELLVAEQEIEAAASREEHRQAAEAAAAAARAKKMVTLAAREKADEEAAIQAAHLAAAEEAEALALLQLAQERAGAAAARKSELESRALNLERLSARHTQDAATASAEQDAHQKGFSLVHQKMVSAEKMVHSAEAETRVTGLPLPSSTTTTTATPTRGGIFPPSSSRHIPHEEVRLQHQTVEGTGSSITTTGPKAAEKMSGVLSSGAPPPASSHPHPHPPQVAGEPPFVATPLPGASPVVQGPPAPSASFDKDRIHQAIRDPNATAAAVHSALEKHAAATAPTTTTSTTTTATTRPESSTARRR